VAINLSIESGQFSRLAAQLTKATKGKTRNVMKEVARAFVKDCMKMTPPFGGQPVKESWKAQRDIGMAAIKGDLFGGTRGSQGKTKRVGIFEQMPKAWLDTVIKDQGDDETTVYWHDKSGKPFGAERQLFRPDATSVPMREHHKRYFRGGRMSSAGTKDRQIGRWKWIDKMIVPPQAATRYLRLMQSRVGTAKSGWVKAAQGLGLKGIPKWITRQRGASHGIFKVGRAKGWPQYTVGNSVPYIQSKGRELGIIRRALRFRIVAMRKQLASTLRANRRR